MTESDTRELSLETIRRFVAYDTNSGEVVAVHEIMSEEEPYEDSEARIDPESVRRMILRDFERLSIEVLEVPQKYELKPGASYWVDLVSGELMEASKPPERLRDFIRREASS